MTNTQEAFDKWSLSNQPEYFHANVIERIKDRKIKAFRTYESDFTEGKWLSWQACQAHNDAVIAELRAEVQHWKAYHAHEVERARLLKVRTDLPIERLQAYDRASIDNINELVVALEIMTPIYHQLAWIAVCWNDHNFDADDVYKKVNTAFMEAGFKKGDGVEPVNNFVKKLDNLIAKHKKGTPSYSTAS